MGSVYARGPAAYRMLRNKVGNRLADPSTLKRHQTFTFIGPGEIPGFRDIVKAFVKTLNPLQRMIMVYFDEMTVSQHLYYDKVGDRVVGKNFNNGLLSIRYFLASVFKLKF
jgi:hypothetical protein